MWLRPDDKLICLPICCRSSAQIEFLRRLTRRWYWYWRKKKGKTLWLRLRPSEIMKGHQEGSDVIVRVLQGHQGRLYPCRDESA